MNQFPANPESRKLLQQVVLAAAIFIVLLFAFLLGRTPQKAPPATTTVASPPPVTSNSTTPAERAFVDKFSRELTDKQKSYEGKIAECTPRLKVLLTPESFASAAAMQAAKKSLDDCSQLDFALYTGITNMIDTLPERLAQEPMSAAERREVLESFRVGTFDMVQQLDDQHRQEMIWVEAVHDVYNYALHNANRIRILGGKITSPDDIVRNGLNSRILRAAKLTDEFESAHGKAGPAAGKQPDTKEKK